MAGVTLHELEGCCGGMELYAVNMPGADAENIVKKVADKFVVNGGDFCFIVVPYVSTVKRHTMEFATNRGIITALRHQIEKYGLGNLRLGGRGMVNPNSGNPLSVYIWDIDRDGMFRLGRKLVSRRNAWYRSPVKPW